MSAVGVYRKNLAVIVVFLVIVSFFIFYHKNKIHTAVSSSQVTFLQVLDPLVSLSKNTVFTDTNDQSIIVASSLVSNQSCNCKTNNNDNTKVIIGGMSFIGSRLALLLHERKEKHLQVVEDIVSVDRDEMKWYRWTKLNAKGLQLNIRDYSEVKHILELQGPDSKLPIDIVYIPSLLFNSNEVKRSRLISALKNFVTFVNTVSKQFKIRARMIVILPKEHTWNYVFQNALQSYFKTGTNCICATILQIDRNLVYGPWQDTVNGNKFEKSGMYIDNVLKIIHDKITTVEIVTSNKEEAGQSGQEHSSTLKWIQEYTSVYIRNQTRNVAMCGVLQHVQHRHPGNPINTASLFDYFRNWLMTVDKYGPESVVFCDAMSDGFVSRGSSRFKKTEFIKVKANQKWSPNDQRFYMIYDYLLSHPDVKYITTTDARDVRFLNDPANIMKGIGDYYFIGADDSYHVVSDHGWIVNRVRRCFPNHPLLQQTLRLHGFFNCGVLGGTRTLMLNLISHMIVLLEKTNPRVICDMAVVEMIAHSEEFIDLVYFGYPFNTDFRTVLAGPIGIAIKHK